MNECPAWEDRSWVWGARSGNRSRGLTQERQAGIVPIPWNRTDRLPPEKQHGAEHDMGNAIDGEGFGSTGIVITENAATTADTHDPNLANKMSSVRTKVRWVEDK